MNQSRDVDALEEGAASGLSAIEGADGRDDGVGGNAAGGIGSAASSNERRYANGNTVVAWRARVIGSGIERPRRHDTSRLMFRSHAR